MALAPIGRLGSRAAGAGRYILTFDFEHFRASRPATGFWMLIVDEARYLNAVER